MTAWYRSRRADFGLRASGLLLCGIAYAAVACLCAMRISPQTVGALACALAAIGFLGASAGSAMVLLGHHLFNQIEVSARWRHRSREIMLPPETSKATDTAGLSMHCHRDQGHSRSFTQSSLSCIRR